MSDRVLVMDTNVLLGGPLRLLAALAERGYLLRVSINGLEERLSRALDAGDIEPLRRRLRNIAPFVDPERPFAPQGSPLFALVGAPHDDPVLQRRDAEYNAMLPHRWRALLADHALPDWQAFALGMKQSIDGGATLVQMEHIALNGTPRDGVTYDRLRSETAKMIKESHPVARRFGASRLDAYIGRLAMMIYDPEMPAENDVEDLELLQHLVDDVILLSADHRFIVKVDGTKSVQAPFVRSPWEVLAGLAPLGPPWGPSAMEAAEAHLPRTRRSLSAIEAEMRASIGG